MGLDVRQEKFKIMLAHTLCRTYIGSKPKWWNWQTRCVQGAVPVGHVGSNPTFGIFLLLKSLIPPYGQFPAKSVGKNQTGVSSKEETPT
jgi:hypothetical protein